MREGGPRLRAEVERLRARVSELSREAEERWRAETMASALVEVGRDLSETLDLTQAADRVVSVVLRLFGVRYAVLYRLDPLSGALVCVSAAGFREPNNWVGTVLPPGTGVSGRAVTDGGPIWSADPLSDPRITVPEWVVEQVGRDEGRATAAVPLISRGKSVGALAVRDVSGREFSEADLCYLFAFADQAALALENARLHEETARRQREAEVIARLVGEITASLDVDDVLRHVVASARDLSGADSAWLVLRDPRSWAMRLEFHHSAGALTAGYEGRPIEPGVGAGGLVLQSGRPFRTEQYRTDPRIAQALGSASEGAGSVALLVVPIKSGERIEGLLYVGNASPRPFTDRDEHILLRLAGHAGVASGMRGSTPASRPPAPRRKPLGGGSSTWCRGWTRWCGRPRPRPTRRSPARGARGGSPSSVSGSRRSWVMPPSAGSPIPASGRRPCIRRTATGSCKRAAQRSRRAATASWSTGCSAPTAACSGSATWSG